MQSIAKMNKRIILLIAIVLLVACEAIPPTDIPVPLPTDTLQSDISATAMTIQPMATEPIPIVTDEPTPTQETDYILNDNPELIFGGCEHKHFTTEQWGRDWYYQCWPAGYSIYETTCNALKIDIDYTGSEYCFALGGRCGNVGFHLSTTILPEGCIQVQVTGFRFVYGDDNYNLRGFISLAGGAGRSFFHPSQIRGNGDYETNFYVLVSNRDSYDITVYFDMIYPTMTAESFDTIKAIYVREVTPGHCELAPEI